MSKNDKTLKNVQAYLANLERAKKISVRVGLPVEKASAAVYDNGMTVSRLGAIHEFGGTFNHPGGTPYKFNKLGQVVFVKKGTKGAVGVTKPHKITIPQRSFLRATLIKKEKEMKEFISGQYKKILEKGLDAKKAASQIGVTFSNFVQDAFSTGGFGDWEKNKASTIRKKKSNMPLVDGGTLRKAITFVVDE